MDHLSNGGYVGDEVDNPHQQPQSTFGLVGGSEDDRLVVDALSRLGRWPEFDRARLRATGIGLAHQIRRDAAIVEATGRWRNDVFLRDEYVPGDVLGHRARLAAAGVNAAVTIALLDAERSPLVAEHDLWAGA